MKENFKPNINPRAGYEKFVKAEFNTDTCLPSLNFDKEIVVFEAEKILREKVNALDW